MVKTTSSVSTSCVGAEHPLTYDLYVMESAVIFSSLKTSFICRTSMYYYSGRRRPYLGALNCTLKIGRFTDHHLYLLATDYWYGHDMKSPFKPAGKVLELRSPGGIMPASHEVITINYKLELE